MNKLPKHNDRDEKGRFKKGENPPMTGAEHQARYRKRRPDIDKKWKSENREKMNGYNKDWRKRNPEKTSAKNIIDQRIHRGTMDKPRQCPVCGLGGQIDGHHRDYSKPLEVFWCCQQCHRIIHKQAPVVRVSRGWVQRHLKKIYSVIPEAKLHMTIAWLKEIGVEVEND